MILGLATAGTVEFGSDEEKFMKREVDYCAAQRLSRQGIKLNLMYRVFHKYRFSSIILVYQTLKNRIWVQKLLGEIWILENFVIFMKHPKR